MGKSVNIRLFSMLVAGTMLLTPVAHAQAFVYRIRVGGSIQLKVSELVDLALGAAERAGAVLILDIESSGGRVDIAQLIVDDLDESAVPVYALVNSRAWSAAALLALAADSIFMVERSSIGAGTSFGSERDEMSEPAARAMRNDFRVRMERRGLDPRLGAAMVDKGVTIGGVVDAGEWLTLEAEAAVQLGMAAAQVNDFEHLLTRLGLDGHEVVTVGSNWTGTTVQVKNYNLMDARIYVFRGKVRYRLGTVTSMGSAEFDVPDAFLPDGARIRVVAELIGSSERTETEEMGVEPGLMVQWVLENRLSQSNYFLFVRP